MICSIFIQNIYFFFIFEYVTNISNKNEIEIVNGKRSGQISREVQGNTFELIVDRFQLY